MPSLTMSQEDAVDDVEQLEDDSPIEEHPTKDPITDVEDDEPLLEDFSAEIEADN